MNRLWSGGSPSPLPEERVGERRPISVFCSWVDGASDFVTILEAEKSVYRIEIGGKA